MVVLVTQGAGVWDRATGCHVQYTEHACILVCLYSVVRILRRTGVDFGKARISPNNQACGSPGALTSAAALPTPVARIV